MHLIVFCLLADSRNIKCGQVCMECKLSRLIVLQRHLTLNEDLLSMQQINFYFTRERYILISCNQYLMRFTLFMCFTFSLSLEIPIFHRLRATFFKYNANDVCLPWFCTVLHHCQCVFGDVVEVISEHRITA